MRTLKVRFVKHTDYYTAERKTLFGWKSIGYWQSCMGGSVRYEYNENTKKQLLDTILSKKYYTALGLINIIQYPTIKKY